MSFKNAALGVASAKTTVRSAARLPSASTQQPTWALANPGDRTGSDLSQGGVILRVERGLRDVDKFGYVPITPHKGLTFYGQ